MTRKLLVCVLLAALVCFAEVQAAEEPADDDAVAAWFLGDYEVMGLRLGYAKRTVELGGEMTWGFGLAEENDPVAYGGYALYNFPEGLSIEQLPLFTWAQPFLKTATYVGLRGGIQSTWLNDGEDDERWYFGPLVGVNINKFVFESVRDTIDITTEVQYNRFTRSNDTSDQDEVRVMLGLCIKVP